MRPAIKQARDGESGELFLAPSEGELDVLVESRLLGVEAFGLFAQAPLFFFERLGLGTLATELNLGVAQVLLEEQGALLEVIDDAVGIGLHESGHAFEESHGLVLSVGSSRMMKRRAGPSSSS